MKKQTLLFVALVAISIATTSCQKEEGILPATDHSSLENAEKSSPIVIVEDMQETAEKEVPQGISIVQPANGQSNKDTLEVLTPTNADILK